MRFNIITLFPDMVESILEFGVIGRALKNKHAELGLLNPRKFADNRHKNIDDRPFGGGPGMVIQYDPLFRAMQALEAEEGGIEELIFLSPQGEQFDHDMAKQFATKDNVTLLCGRYEGVDQRFIDRHVDREISIGDYVLSGGELAACVMIDAIVRLIPGVLGHEQSSATDSFMNGRLGCPQYTRSDILGQSGVPDVLLSGDHDAIEKWRVDQSEEITRQKRPDLLAGTSEHERNVVSSDNNE